MKAGKDCPALSMSSAETQIAVSYARGWCSHTLPRVAVAPAARLVVSQFEGSARAATLYWHTDHIGWRLPVQTNSSPVGLGANWFDVPSSTVTNQLTFTLDPSAGCVFYRLACP